MSFALRRKIRHCAGMLSEISSSRLTEELLKIINSSCAQKIVSEALDTDLYMSLQPGASAIMYADRKFERDYMENLANLDKLTVSEPDARLGKKLIYLIKDFILTLTDWEKELENKTPPRELYMRTWRECRSFVLPMNPQRIELEFAVKSVLQEIGIPVKTVKNIRTGRRHRLADTDKTI